MNKNTNIITICKKCAHCEPSLTWSDPSTYWCNKISRTRLDWVSGKTVINKKYCKDVNIDGHCPLYGKK